MIPSNDFPPIEFPDKPIPMEEAIAAEREVVAAKLNFAEDINTGMPFRVIYEPATTPTPVAIGFIFDEHITTGYARLLRAEARSQEIQLHNNLYQAGQLHAQMQRQAGLIQVPGLVKQ